MPANAIPSNRRFLSSAAVAGVAQSCRKGRVTKITSRTRNAAHALSLSNSRILSSVFPAAVRYAADAAIRTVREDLMALFAEMNAMHMQIGKKYRYLDGMDPAARSLVTGIKSLLDPDRLMNPKTLGFD